MIDEVDLELLNRAATWMQRRGWRRIQAKEQSYRQSLFEHGLNGLDVVLRLAPVLARPAHMDLSPDECRVLQAAVLAHDVGKESGDFQQYIAGRIAYASHIDEERTRQVVPEVCDALGFSDISTDVMRVIESCIQVHHPSPASVVQGMLQRDPRWWPLARVVMAIDHLCSARSLLDARETLERDILGQFLHVSYHQVDVRGVSTTLLHRAAENAFVAAGWIPVLCFANGTLYVADGAAAAPVTTVEDITERLRQEIDERLSEQDLSGIIVGSPRASILPKPELVDFTKVKSYLLVASKRIRRGSFIKKKPDHKRAKVALYLKLSGRAHEPLSDAVIAREAARIDAAQPEMMVFKLFKALTAPAVLGNEGALIAATSYELLFGRETWGHLQSSSTLDAARDLARTVDYFWRLPGERFDLPAETMEEVESEERTRRLAEALAEIIAGAREVTQQPSPVESLARDMAAGFIRQLVAPAVVADPRALAQEQLQSYAQSKATAGKRLRNAVYLCPLCSRKFDHHQGEPASADFVAKPESHTNRAIAHGPFDRIVICNGCRYERVILQVLVGRTPVQMIILLPQMNIGRGAGAIMAQKVADWIDDARAVIAGPATSDVTLKWTSLIAERLGDTPPEALSAKELTRIVTYRISDDKRKRRLRDLLKALQDTYEDDLPQANAEWGTTYISWGDAAHDLLDDKLHDPEARNLRGDVLGRFPTMHRVGETPNLLLLPLTLPIAANDDESPANRALRELFVLILLGLAFDVAVLTANEGEAIEWTGGEGVARVPAVPAVRSLIGDEWVQAADALHWLHVIGAAARLGQACNFSSRSDLFRVLTESPPERLLARIDQAGTGAGARIEHIRLIETIKEARL